MGLHLYFVHFFQVKLKFVVKLKLCIGRMLKPKLWIWGQCRVVQIFMSNYSKSKIQWKIQILHRSAYWAPCWSLSYEFEDNAMVVPRFFYAKSFQIKNSMKNSNLASVGLLSTMLKPKLWIWGRCRVSQIFMSAHASFKNRSLFGLVSAYHSFFFPFFPPHHNRKKNRRQCKDMDNCLVQFVPFKNISNTNVCFIKIQTTHKSIFINIFG